jgi:hypothetical protein
LRVLISTANGMGISPVPLEEVDEQPVEEPKNSQRSPVPVGPVPPLPSQNITSILSSITNELGAIREEIAFNKKNNEVIYMELSRMKLAMNLGEGQRDSPMSDIGDIIKSPIVVMGEDDKKSPFEDVLEVKSPTMNGQTESSIQGS